VLSHRFWPQTLGGDSKVIGDTLRLDDGPCIVLGVMPGGFSFYPEAAAMWSLITREQENKGNLATGIFARLKSGVSVEAAQRELRFLHRQASAGARQRR
jgi:hypothetical protein